jgi:hypothetical protein
MGIALHFVLLLSTDIKGTSQLPDAIFVPEIVELMFCIKTFLSIREYMVIPML